MTLEMTLEARFRELGIAFGIPESARRSVLPGGAIPATPERTLLAQICTALYFAFFILMPWYTRMESTKPVPERVTG